MSRLLWRAGVVGVAALLGALEAGRAAGSDAPSAGRQAELLHLLRHDCGSCHGLTLKGGLGPPLLPEALAERSDEVLAETILRGRPGTPMPPWEFALSRDDIAWLVGILRNGNAHDR